MFRIVGVPISRARSHSGAIPSIGAHSSSTAYRRNYLQSVQSATTRRVAPVHNGREYIVFLVHRAVEAVQSTSLTCQAHTRMVILLLSLLDSNNATVQLEALCVCNELTFHVDNTVTLCKREDFMLRIRQAIFLSGTQSYVYAIFLHSRPFTSTITANWLWFLVRNLST
jgi:hypothetical protein